jgi:hypothetical protein
VPERRPKYAKFDGVVSRPVFKCSRMSIKFLVEQT